MSWILDLALQGGLPLLMGILAGQKVRITLNGKKLPVKVRSRKGIGKSGAPTPAPVSDQSPSPSPQESGLPFIIDRDS